MHLADCPACSKTLLVPSGQRNVIARCPLCDKEFPVSDLSTQEIPTAIVVQSRDEEQANGDDDQRRLEIALSSQESSLVDESDAKFGEYRLAEVDSESVVAVGKEAAAIPSPFRVSQDQYQVSTTKRQNRRKNDRSFFGEIVKIFLGGVAGLVIAQLILWWLPGNWRRDPLGLATHLPDYAEFLAPKTLRRPAQLLDAKESTIRDSEEPTSNDLDASDRLSKRSEPLDSDIPESASQDRHDTRSSRSATDSITGNSDPFHDSETPEVVRRPIESVPNEHLAIRHEIGLTSGDEVHVSELIAKLEQVSTLAAALSSAEKGTGLRAAQRQFYIRLADLARAVTYVIPKETLPAAELENVRKFLTTTAGNRHVFDEIIGIGGASWIGYPNRQTSGIAIAGFVRDVRAEGAYVELKVEHAGRPNRDTFVLQPAYRNKPISGDAVVILGTIVDDPAVQIIDYVGSRERVIWAGMIANVSLKAE